MKERKIEGLIKGCVASISVFLLFYAAEMVMAQKLLWPAGGIAGVREVSGLWGVVCGVSVWLFYTLIFATIIFVIWAAYLYLTSGGESEKVQKATKTLTYAAVAVVVALIARGFPYIISSLVGSGTLSVVCR